MGGEGGGGGDYLKTCFQPVGQYEYVHGVGGNEPSKGYTKLQSSMDEFSLFSEGLAQ